MKTTAEPTMTTIPKLTDLTPEQKRGLIAGACGRCAHTDTKYWCIEDGNDFDSGFICNKCGNDPHCPSESVPDYLADLNAMHGAEKTLRDREKFLFGKELWRITPTEMWHATAAQRADAFLLAKGLAQ